MKRNFGIIILGILTVFFNIKAFGATPAQMEQARAIAAKYYLRFANNGSDYLDNINPVSVADLESQLKETEKENLKWFKSAKTATDFAPWDKEQLTKYWSSTFFSDNSSSLTDEKKRDAANNGLAHKSIANAISKMQVTAETEKKPETTEPETRIPDNDAQLEITNQTDNREQLENQIAALEEELENAPQEPVKKERNSGLWVYIMVLCILIAIVVALAVYAAKTMKQQKQKKEELEERTEVERTVTVSDEGRLREKFAESLAAKTAEIQTLKRTITGLEDEVAEMKAEVSRLRQENQSLRLKTEQASLPPKEEPATIAAVKTKRAVREVYLGRVNERGLFVRADRSPVPGITMFRLTTTNGLTGTFETIDDIASIAVALEDPEKWLAGACVAKDITDTDDKDSMVTLNPGTAIFEDGAWRVLRKAKISFI